MLKVPVNVDVDVNVGAGKNWVENDCRSSIFNGVRF